MRLVHLFESAFFNFQELVLQQSSAVTPPVWRQRIKKQKHMKKIEAIIRKTKFEDVKEALLQSDIDWFEYHNVHGIGQSREERIYRGVQYSTDVIERVALTIVCRDQFVKPTVEVILKVAHTGEIGDGRIFVSEMIDTYSIRTGENGDIVLRDKK